MAKRIGPASRLSLQAATVADAKELAALHTAVAEHLTKSYGRGPWSSKSSEKGTLLALRTSQVFIARENEGIVATLRLTAKKPWAIDTSYFAESDRPLYLLAMAVAPTQQRRGLGRQCLQEVQRIARDWPSDAVRLDAYDAPAGAGDFYARCGYEEVGKATYRNTPLAYYELRLR